MRPKSLFRTQIMIWSEYPTDGVELEDLARDATSGEAYCEFSVCELVEDPAEFPQTEFFDLPE